MMELVYTAIVGVWSRLARHCGPGGSAEQELDVDDSLASEGNLMKSAVWVSYDLGVQGDYEGIYAWLDEHGAQECGDSLAFLSYDHTGPLLKALTADLKKSVDTTKRTRIYIIYREADTKKMKGRFILGGRKAPPWSGFGENAVTVESDEI